MTTSTTAGGATLIAPGAFDNQTVHAVCIVDPSTGYSALYTNGILALSQSGAIPALTNISPSWSYVGRSVFSAYPWLNANVEELRIYDGRLSPADIAANDQFGAAALALPVTLVESGSPSGLTLSWPSWAVGFVPQSTGDLASGIWTTLPTAPTLAADQWSVTVPQNNSVQYYRLQR